MRVTADDAGNYVFTFDRVVTVAAGVDTELVSVPDNSDFTMAGGVGVEQSATCDGGGGAGGAFCWLAANDVLIAGAGGVLQAGPIVPA